jgi:UDP-glucose:(heptosyl)LPS alpha-1,3-glucosyltransferase
VPPAMRLALVIERFDPESGGAPRNAAEVARLMAERGHRVTVLSGQPAGNFLPPGVTVESSSLRRLRGASSMQRFARWARERLAAGGFDASLSMTTAVPATVLQPLSGTFRETLARNIALRRSLAGRWLKRLLVSLSPKQRLLLALEARALCDPLLRVVAAPSRYVVEQCQRHYGLEEGRMVIVTNAVDLPEPPQAHREAWRRSLRARFGIEEQVVYLFSAFNPRLKGFQPLVHALRRVAAKGVDAVVLAAGGCRSWQRRLVGRLGLERRVRFLGAWRQVEQLYCASDVTVLPTFYDPASRVVIESLVLGVPAISTAYNGASELIRREDGRWCGRILADPGDAGALAAAMVELADPEERRRASKATAGIAPLVSMRRHVERLESLLEQHARAE